MESAQCIMRRNREKIVRDKFGVNVSTRVRQKRLLSGKVYVKRNLAIITAHPGRSQ